MGGGYNSILDRMLEDVKRSRRHEIAINSETGLPNLPLGEPPFPEGIPGLPPYTLIAVEDVIEEGSLEEPTEARVVFESAPQIFVKTKDKLDKKIDDFLRQI